MNVQTLRQALEGVPDDAEVSVRVLTENGFYDVPSQSVSGGATGFVFSRHENTFKVEAKKGH